MDKLIITNMTLEDIEQIMVIEQLSFKIPWTRESFISELNTNRLAVYIVAKLDGKVVGYAGMWKVLDEGHITNIAVHPKLRHKKIATKMIEILINIAKKNNITKLTLEVRKSNILAQHLYENFGFEALGSRKKYYADNQEDALIMWKVV